MNRFIPLLAIIVMLPLFGLGCPEKPDSLVEQEEQARQELKVIDARGSGDCAHDYYPLLPDYSITYRNTSGDEQTEYTMTVVEASDTAAKMEFTFTEDEEMAGELTFTQELACSGGNLLPQGYLDMSSAFGDVKISIETENVEGILLPHLFEDGTTWETSYDLTITPEEGTFPMAGFGSLRSAVSLANSVVAEETITVSAGTFDTLKVEVVTTTVTEIPGMPASVPPTESAVISYQWWAKDVGLVKMENSDGSSTTEAVEVFVP
ncbi:MAG: hypothetical protein U9Q03_03665 [Patescibacteria group bacterium]|nr:hypothetical protein [Patescibacteria group bacterium]